jgi:UDP-N-acetylmuramoyl-L-alanyl-D-glutamate--2,6-diaminopimelate ligase
MGKIVASLADFVILTSDNPRTEDPLAIIRDILPGLSGPHLVIPDRREAIFRALDLARPGDTVILCGKGHETTQETGGHRLPMDERQIIAEYINGS